MRHVRICMSCLQPCPYKEDLSKKKEDSSCAGFRYNTSRECVAGEGRFDASTFAVKLYFENAIKETDAEVTVILRHKAPLDAAAYDQDNRAGDGYPWRNITLLHRHPLSWFEGSYIELLLTGTSASEYDRAAQDGTMRPFQGGELDLQNVFGGADVSGVWTFDVFNHGVDQFSGKFGAELQFLYRPPPPQSEIQNGPSCYCNCPDNSTYVTAFTEQSLCTPLKASAAITQAACANSTSVLGYTYRQVRLVQLHVLNFFLLFVEHLRIIEIRKKKLENETQEKDRFYVLPDVGARPQQPPVTCSSCSAAYVCVSTWSALRLGIL